MWKDVEGLDKDFNTGGRVRRSGQVGMTGEGGYTYRPNRVLIAGEVSKLDCMETGRGRMGDKWGGNEGMGLAGIV